MAQREASTAPTTGRSPWSFVRRGLFDGVVVGLIGACLVALNVHFAPRNPGVAIAVGAGGFLLLWIGSNLVSDAYPLKSSWGEGRIRDWFHLVLWSILAAGVVVGTASTILAG